ncbi:hypothetical protein [uncultured Tateyamaria sp.]|uniref:hypothetical protein n=1 Tax=uncultured Tateyamaria sp. TaxID=455651 RepID=UPI00263498B8|nr:hypothetical protein [uncultured Tateyamaria sp.]
MAVLLPTLVVLNVMLGIALVVAKMRLMDERHALRVRQEQDLKSHFRNDRRY